ncbi:MAG TPA: Fur family transcriptional regulator [Planctomycetota bacterium]|nr:Fur family transcriptional regulator [Planctomycetota bacterium]
MHQHEDAFREFLAKRGLKLTPERRLILEEVFRQHDHFEAEELLFRMRQRKVRVSKATLYRTLPLLVKAGLLREEVFGERHLHYEHVHGRKHHDHLLCLSCGKIEEFLDETMEQLQDRVCARHGFDPTGHRLEIHGYCKECRKRRG